MGKNRMPDPERIIRAKLRDLANEARDQIASELKDIHAGVIVITWKMDDNVAEMAVGRFESDTNTELAGILRKFAHELLKDEEPNPEVN